MGAPESRPAFFGGVRGGMRNRFGMRIAGVVVVAAIWGAWSGRPVRADEDASRSEFYTSRVRPIFAANCLRCHGGMNHRGGLSMETRSGLLKGGKGGAVLVPGDPGKSLLVKLMRHEGPADDPMPMPPAPRAKVADADIAAVERWVRAGAVMPEDQPKP